MEQLELLETLANSAFPDFQVNQIFQDPFISDAIKQAFLLNDSDQLKNILSSGNHFPNEIFVANFQIFTSSA